MGLRLAAITVEGFGSYGPNPQTVTFNGAGPCAIVGDNGAGKSTIVSKALTWALYGKTTPERMGSGTRAISGKAVVNPLCDKAVVEVRLANSVDEYIIKRTRGKKGGDVLEVRVEGSQEQTLDPTEATIENIVGADYFVFTRTVVRGQGDLWSFSEATDKAKRELLDIVSGAFVLAEAETRAKAIQKAATSKASQYEMLEGTTERKLEGKNPEGYELKVSQWEVDHKAQVEAVKRELEQAIEAEQEAEKQDKTLGKRKTAYQQLIDSKPELDRSTYQAVLEQADRLHREATIKHRQAHAELHKLEGLSEGDDCPTCGQVVRADAPIVDRVLSAKSEVESTGAELEPLTQHREDCQRSMREADEWYSGEVSAWQKEVSDFGSLPTEAAPGAKRYRQQVEARLQGMLGTVNPYIEALKHELQQVDELTHELVIYRAARKYALNEASMAETWATALSSKGARAHIAESALVAIESEANEWLTILTAGQMGVSFPATREVGGRTKEDIKTIIQSRKADGTVESRDLLTYSGGERRRINLAVDLGVAAAFTNSELSLSLLVLDEEVFSGMDEAGKSAVVHALHGAGIEDVVMIDHDPRLSSTLPRTVKVSRGPDGFSQVDIEEAMK